MFHRFAFLLSVTALLLTGCSSGGFGNELTATPKSSALAANTAFKVPQQAKFSIAIPTSEEKPGLGGKADADSTADAAGSASATASIENGGRSLGGFQLGHAFRNDGSTQTDLEITVRFRAEFELAGDAKSTSPDAIVDLFLYARDGRNRLVRDQAVTAATSANGPVKRASNENITFTITIGAGETATVYLGGQVKAETPDGRSARGSLKLADVEIEAAPRSAPAVAPAEKK